MTLTIQSAMRKDISTGKSVSLQHRHFAFIAAVVAGLDPYIRIEVANDFADACGKTNPNFDRERFMRACGV